MEAEANVEDTPMRFGTNRKTFSEYVCAVARSTANLASTTSTLRPLLRMVEVIQDIYSNSSFRCVDPVHEFVGVEQVVERGNGEEGKRERKPG